MRVRILKCRESLHAKNPRHQFYQISHHHWLSLSDLIPKLTALYFVSMHMHTQVTILILNTPYAVGRSTFIVVAT